MKGLMPCWSTIENVCLYIDDRSLSLPVAHRKRLFASVGFSNFHRDVVSAFIHAGFLSLHPLYITLAHHTFHD